MRDVNWLAESLTIYSYLQVGLADPSSFNHILQEFEAAFDVLLAVSSGLAYRLSTLDFMQPVVHIPHPFYGIIQLWTCRHKK